MGILATSRDNDVQFDGHVYLQAQAGTEFVEKDLPLATTGARVRPVLLKYAGKIFIIGQFSAPLVYTQTGKLWQMGIPPPPAAPVMAVGTSSGGSDGFAIGYLTFLEIDLGNIVAESNPSEPSATIELNGQGRSWTGIPATSINPRVTHVRGYVSMDGSAPGVAWERQLGVTSVTENTDTSELGERLPVSVSTIDGEVEVQIYDRGVPPNGRFAEIYHDALWISGDYDNPTRVYFSKLFEPEAFNTVDKDRGWFDTLDGETVTGIQRWGDLLVVGCLRATYAIQGFDSGDYQMIKLSNFYGTVSHHAMKRIGPDADLWSVGQEGPWMYDGSFHDLFEDDLRDFWQVDYRAKQTRYEDCFAGEDRFFRTYQLVIPPDEEGNEPLTFKYICHWQPVVQSKSKPWVTFDVRDRLDNAIGSIIISDSDHFAELLSGSDDGIIRQENILTDSDDNGDGYLKAMTVTSKHYFFGDQGGDDAHGHNYEDLDVYLKNENTAVTVSAYGGDDSANQAASPQWARTIPAGAVTVPRPRVPRTSLHFSNISECNGKGVTLKFTASEPVGVGLRGFAIYHTLGQQERPFSS